MAVRVAGTAMATDPLASLRTEWRRYRRLAGIAFEAVDVTDLCRAIDDDEGGDGDSTAVPVRRLVDKLRSRITEVPARHRERPRRQREEQFAPRRANRVELLSPLHEVWDAVERDIDEGAANGADALARTLTIRGEPLTELDAFARSVADVACHVGEIVRSSARSPAVHGFRTRSRGSAA